MKEAAFWEREYHGVTTLHSFGLLAIIVLGIILLMAPRRYAVLPLLVMACFVAPAQRVVVMGLDFNLIRILVLFGAARVVLWQEHRGFKWHTIDTLILLWALSQTTFYTLQRGSTGALINRLGVSFDAVGIYFLIRVFVRSWEDVVITLKGVVLISVPVLLAFIVENRTGRNLFAFLGGVPEVTAIRAGRLRCQGAFAHAILAGTFWAALAPHIAALWWLGGASRLYAIVGVPICVALVGLCASSTPAAALVFGVVAALMWPLRYQMRWIRYGLAGTLILLHMIMEAPVWHLIARIDIVGGSTGWHRYNLFDQFIKHFSEWWMVGSATMAHWGQWGLSDITNQYILEAMRGGLVTLLIFLAIISLAFREVGRLWRRVESVEWQAAIAWSFGVALFVHVTAFFAVSYFGQIIVIWYMLLAMIVSLGTAGEEERA